MSQAIPKSKILPSHLISVILSSAHTEVIFVLFFCLILFKPHWLLFLLFLKYQTCSSLRIFVIAVPSAFEIHIYISHIHIYIYGKLYHFAYMYIGYIALLIYIHICYIALHIYICICICIYIYICICIYIKAKFVFVFLSVFCSKKKLSSLSYCVRYENMSPRSHFKEEHTFSGGEYNQQTASNCQLHRCTSFAENDPLQECLSCNSLHWLVEKGMYKTHCGNILMDNTHLTVPKWVD